MATLKNLSLPTLGETYNVDASYLSGHQADYFVNGTANQTVGGKKTFSSPIVSSVTTGTAPFSVASTTVVPNLNADMLSGKHLTNLYGFRQASVVDNTALGGTTWGKVASITLSNNRASILFYVQNSILGGTGSSGFLELYVNGFGGDISFRWLSAEGGNSFFSNFVLVTTGTNPYTFDLYVKTSIQYYATTLTEIKESQNSGADVNGAFTLYNVVNSTMTDTGLAALPGTHITSTASTSAISTTGNAATATLAADSSKLGGTAAASYMKLSDFNSMLTDGSVNAYVNSLKLPSSVYASSGALSIYFGTTSAADYLYFLEANGKLRAIMTVGQDTYLYDYPLKNGTVALASTTLAGYGITNAYTKAEVDGKFSSGTVTDISGSVTDIATSFGSLVLGANEYFDVSGLGTQARPYIVTPKPGINHAKHRYTITYATPSSGGIRYIYFRAATSERCVIHVYSPTAISSLPAWSINLYNADNRVRPRIINNKGSCTMSVYDIAFDTPFAADFDVNSPEIWTTHVL